MQSARSLKAATARLFLQEMLMWFHTDFERKLKGCHAKLLGQKAFK